MNIPARQRRISDRPPTNMNDNMMSVGIGVENGRYVTARGGYGMDGTLEV